MKNILTISGSARTGSANRQLLEHLPVLFPELDFHLYEIAELPLFVDDAERTVIPEPVEEWRRSIQKAQAVIISTPEYVHNIPAILKNALEWVYATGEMAGKKILPIVFTPKPPRGDKAMQSLLFTLTALEAQVVASLQLYQEDWNDQNRKTDAEEMIRAAIDLL
ncbi:MAG: NAD(P)H-dependent oxidoreductase [Bacteroidia bacterium]|nr:NAD(P)H-dependent oxidoreductase [Bacteroidia bacterium]